MRFGKMSMLIALLALVPLALGCSDDDPAAPGGGGQDKVLAAGVYTVTFEFTTCPTRCSSSKSGKLSGRRPGG